MEGLVRDGRIGGREQASKGVINPEGAGLKVVLRRGALVWCRIR